MSDGTLPPMMGFPREHIYYGADSITVVPESEEGYFYTCLVNDCRIYVWRGVSGMDGYWLVGMSAERQRILLNRRLATDYMYTGASWYVNMDPLALSCLIHDITSGGNDGKL